MAVMCKNTSITCIVSHCRLLRHYCSYSFELNREESRFQTPRVSFRRMHTSCFTLCFSSIANLLPSGRADCTHASSLQGSGIAARGSLAGSGSCQSNCQLTKAEPGLRAVALHFPETDPLGPAERRPVSAAQLVSH